MELKAKVFNGLKWSAFAKGLTQLLSWVSTFIVIRILTSEDYGIVALVTITFELVSILSINGFSATLVKSQKKCRAQASQVFSISLLINLCFCIIVAFFAENIAQFYNNEQLIMAIWVMAIFTPLNSLLVIPSAYLDIDMRFKAKAIAESIAAFASMIIALSLALLGFEFWALIAASITALIVRAIGFQKASQCRYGLTMNFKNSSQLFKFAYKLQLNTLLWFAYNKLDSILIGRFLGISKLGIYNVGLEIASIPMVKVSGIINQVGFSAFSSLKEDQSAATYYFNKAVLTLSLIAFPIFMGISSVSYEIVYLLIGEQWLGAAPIIAIFTWIFPFRMINTVIQNYTNGLNMAGFSLQNSVIIAVCLIGAISIGAQIGLEATAYAWVFGFAFAFTIVLFRLKQKLALTVKQLFVWLPVFLISLLMWFGIYLFETSLTTELPIYVILLSKMAIGVIIVTTLYAIFYKNEIKSLIQQ